MIGFFFLIIDLGYIVIIIIDISYLVIIVEISVFSFNGCC